MTHQTITIADMADGHPLRYGAIRRHLAIAPARWIGRCKCGKPARLEGTSADAAPIGTTHFDCSAVVDLEGKVYTCRVWNDDSAVIIRHGCGAWVTVRKVHEKIGAKSAHKCGAKCTNAVGPACDCTCKGANHGRNC